MKIDFKAKGTTCNSCAEIIKRQAMKVEGVRAVDFDYATEQGWVEFDEGKTSTSEIFSKIDEKGYSCSEFASVGSDPEDPDINLKPLGIAFGVIGLLVMAFFGFRFIEGISMPEISAGMGYGLLFVVGLLTGFHCIGMCGGFVVSYTTKAAEKGLKPHKSHLAYGFGKTISYTIIGGLFGLVGSIIAFTPGLRGTVGILAGLFLVLFGLKMLNWFPVLRKINIPTPRFLYRFVSKERKKHSSPLALGLLNGLMIACGPLQAIYIMAAGTGSMIEGAKLLFIFGLGTLPAMIGFGYVVSTVSKKVTHGILKFSGIVVIVLGLAMLNNGLVLTGSGFDFQSMVTGVSAAGITGNAVKNPEAVVMEDGYQVIKMDVNRYGWEPNTFVLKKDVPVKWEINGLEINGCNNAIQVPSYGLDFPVKQGKQVIEFTPTEAGTVRWSCWMGMIPGSFIVKEDIDINDAAAVAKELDNAPVLKGGSCGGSGGCGCGGAA